MQNIPSRISTAPCVYRTKLGLQERGGAVKNVAPRCPLARQQELVRSDRLGLRNGAPDPTRRRWRAPCSLEQHPSSRDSHPMLSGRHASRDVDVGDGVACRLVLALRLTSPSPSNRRAEARGDPLSSSQLVAMIPHQQGEPAQTISRSASISLSTCEVFETKRLLIETVRDPLVCVTKATVRSASSFISDEE